MLPLTILLPQHPVVFFPPHYALRTPYLWCFVVCYSDFLFPQYRTDPANVFRSPTQHTSTTEICTASHEWFLADSVCLPSIPLQLQCTTAVSMAPTDTRFHSLSTNVLHCATAQFTCRNFICCMFTDLFSGSGRAIRQLVSLCAQIRMFERTSRH